MSENTTQTTTKKTLEVSPRVLELYNNPSPEAFKNATVEDLSALAKYVAKQKRAQEKASKSAVSQERMDKINKLKNVHTNFGYTDANEFIKDFRAANMPAVTRSRIAPEKRAKIEEAIRNNVKFASIAVDNDVSESTVGNIKKAMMAREAQSNSSSSTPAS